MSLETLKTRLDFCGGHQQVDRMNVDKLKTLKKALFASYQSATAILADGREFRCLINSDRIENDYDNKFISIPFEDICLNAEKVGKTSEGIQQIGMQPGDVFTWKENNTKWLVFLQRLEETAYFRAEIRRCEEEIQINDRTYYVYVKGPNTSKIDWRGVDIKWNDLNYTLLLYVSKNAITENYFHRFDIVTLNGKPWQVQAVDTFSTAGIVEVALKEFYSNSIEQEIENEKLENNITIDSPIEGPKEVYPYDVLKYTILEKNNGVWKVSNNKARIINQTDSFVEIEIVTSKSGAFDLIYQTEDAEDVVLPITIKSL